MLCNEVLVFGDSHVAIFNNFKMRKAFPQYYFNVVSVGAATVSGLENPNSKTQALPIFKQNLKTSNANTIIVSLGEVDTGFVIWYRSEKYNTEVSEMLDNALRNYRDFLIFLSRDHRVICLSAPLPTIRDGQDWGDVANLRKKVKASQMDRTKLTIYFNESMEGFCLQNKIEYLDFDSESLGKNGLVHAGLINNNINDHHYATEAYIEMIIPKLKRYI